jgi:hypothetical protein
MPPAISLLPPEGRVEDAKKGCEVVVVWLSGEGGSILGVFFYWDSFLYRDGPHERTASENGYRGVPLMRLPSENCYRGVPLMRLPSVRVCLVDEKWMKSSCNTFRCYLTNII